MMRKRDWLDEAYLHPDDVDIGKEGLAGLMRDILGRIRARTSYQYDAVVERVTVLEASDRMRVQELQDLADRDHLILKRLGMLIELARGKRKPPRRRKKRKKAR